MQIADLWLMITALGSAGVAVPCAALVLLGMARAGQYRLALRWLGWLAVAAVLVLTSKLAFTGWGLGLVSLDFTGFSGHATLATAILPVSLAWLFSPGQRTSRWRGWLVAGLALGALVAYSRLVLAVHSPSEAVSGWLIGALVSLLVRDAPGSPRGQRWEQAALALAALVVVMTAGSIAVPTHQWETRLAQALSGNDCPYVRTDLRVQPYAPRAQRCPGLPPRPQAAR